MKLKEYIFYTLLGEGSQGGEIFSIDLQNAFIHALVNDSFQVNKKRIR